MPIFSWGRLERTRSLDFRSAAPRKMKAVVPRSSRDNITRLGVNIHWQARDLCRNGRFLPVRSVVGGRVDGRWDLLGSAAQLAKSHRRVSHRVTAVNTSVWRYFGTNLAQAQAAHYRPDQAPRLAGSGDDSMLRAKGACDPP